MTMYCTICGEELEPEDERKGICNSCKMNQKYDNDVEDELPDNRYL